MRFLSKRQDISVKISVPSGGVLKTLLQVLCWSTVLGACIVPQKDAGDGDSGSHPLTSRGAAGAPPPGSLKIDEFIQSVPGQAVRPLNEFDQARLLKPGMKAVATFVMGKPLTCQENEQLHLFYQAVPKSEGKVFRGIRSFDTAVLPYLRGARDQKKLIGLGPAGARVWTSTSRDPQVALGFAGCKEPYRPGETSYLLVIRQKSGVNIASISREAGEKEVMLAPLCDFRVTRLVALQDCHPNSIGVEVEEVACHPRP